MKKTVCLILSLLLALPLLAGCNDASFLTDPAGESESAAASAPSVIEEERESPSQIPSSAPQKSPSPSPKPLYPELPLPVEEILWFDPPTPFLPDVVFYFGKLMGFPTLKYVYNPEEVSDDQCVAFSLSYSHNDAHQLPEGFKETLEQKGFAVHKSKNPDQLFLFVTRKQVNEAEFTEEELQSIWLEFISEEYYRQNVAPVGYEN